VGFGASLYSAFISTAEAIENTRVKQTYIVLLKGVKLCHRNVKIAVIFKQTWM